ncbi:alpha-N-arabinofuranosidase [Planobispora longispora]|uniref:non-reducing end alpha-L-arabinofuranosidase n=1 Tax=Planobispora longispora TaxID=28887 RepID=A0A8J3RV35_9ACTN|nr:alpha-N-arabinofuranosidase [Planobispora longispora]GIH80094.1 alpha-N-arabinofuranosidase [Planobispora longispora]
MHRASFTLDPAFSVGAVDPRLFGSFVEHLGRCVYTGVHEPGHPAADDNGFRRDVLDLVREMGVTVVRYPGGNFVSGHRWEDGVGPVRRARLEPAWRSVETNEFGLGEFAAWARAAGIEPMMAVNLGTRGVQEACDLLEYANHPGGTHLSDLRAEHGDAEPYGIRMWCLGNEMDGSWQIGHRPAADYGKLAAATARAMRMIDPGLELVACGSSHHSMPTFGAWEEEVLTAAYDDVDHVSLHAYYREENDDPASFLASGSAMEDFIEDVVATCDHVRAKLKRRKRINLSFDEWNVWYMKPMEEEAQPWERAPRLLENTYSLTDAVAVGGMLIALLRHADRVKIACQAQLVNVIAPIMTEPGGPAWRQATFHPFAQAARYGRGEVLRVEPVSPTVETAAYGETPLLHATAVRDAESGTVTVFAVNRALDGPMELTADVRALNTPDAPDGLRVLSHEVLADDDRHAKNTRENPDRVRPRPLEGADAAAVDGGRLRAVLPPLSWNVIRLGR